MKETKGLATKLARRSGSFRIVAGKIANHCITLGIHSVHGGTFSCGLCAPYSLTPRLASKFRTVTSFRAFPRGGGRKWLCDTPLRNAPVAFLEEAPRYHLYAEGGEQIRESTSLSDRGNPSTGCKKDNTFAERKLGKFLRGT